MLFEVIPVIHSGGGRGGTSRSNNESKQEKSESLTDLKKITVPKEVQTNVSILSCYLF